MPYRGRAAERARPDDDTSPLPFHSSHRVFHEYLHPKNWRATVDELFARFGPAGEHTPLDMCPCGGRKATVRRFLVARKYRVDEAEQMLRDTI